MEWTFTFDDSEPKLNLRIKEWEVLALKYIWSENTKGTTTKEVWDGVKEALGETRTISRASIILFLNKMAKAGILDVRFEPGKGGFHGVYSLKMNEKEYQKHIIRLIIDSMKKNYPDEFLEVIKEHAYSI